MTRLDGTTSPLPIPPARGPLAGGNPTAVSRGWERNFCAAVLFVYLFAFALPVFDDTGILANHLGVRPKGAVYGWQAFLVGWFVQRIGWFANVAIWIGIILLARRRPLAAAIAGVLALGLGSMYLVLLPITACFLRSRSRRAIFAGWPARYFWPGAAWVCDGLVRAAAR